MKRLLLILLFSATCFADSGFFVNDPKTGKPQRYDDAFENPFGDTAIDKVQNVWKFIKETKEYQEERENIVDFASPNDYLLPADSPKEQKPLNPISDVCWSCTFPIHIGAVNKNKHHEFIDKNESYFETKFLALKSYCRCGKMLAGIKISFWEPAGIIEATHTPYKFPTFGISLFKSKSVANRGGISHVSDTNRSSFYHAHYIPTPLYRLAAIIPGAECLRNIKEITPPWISEIDPTWRYPKLAAIFSPDMILYATDKAQMACRADCLASTKYLYRPENRYFWCSGCNGSYYPFVGHVAQHVGGVQASSLIAHRALGRAHFVRSAMKLGTGYKEGEFCEQQVFQHLQKSFYKTQLIRPFPEIDRDHAQKACRPLGSSHDPLGLFSIDQTVNQFLTDPTSKKRILSRPEAEDFAYLVWTRKNCCYSFDGIIKDLFPVLKNLLRPMDWIEDAEVVVDLIDKCRDFKKMSKEFDEMLEKISNKNAKNEK